MTNNIFGVSELLNSIEVDQSLPIKAPRDILNADDYKIVTDVFDIIRKYRRADWMADIPEPEQQSDIIALQTSLITLSEKFVMMSSSTDGEADRLKIARSKVRLALKSEKAKAEAEGKQIRITAEDIKDASLALTEKLAEEFENVQTASAFLKFVYYSVRDAVNLLDKSLTRQHSFIHNQDRAR